MSNRTIVALALFFVIIAAFGVEDLPIFHIWMPDSAVMRPPIHHWTLDNGLEVMFWENHTVPIVDARIMIKTGSAFEGKYLGCGISHYLEHLVSGGTTSKHTEDEYKEMIQKYSLGTNAYTTSDVTCYHGSGPKESFPILLSMLADWVQDCQFDTFEVNRETNVILQEMNMGLEEPGRVMWKLYNDLFYKVSPYQYPTIGYRDNFIRITRDELMDYYHNRYAPNNSILAIAGDLDLEEVKNIVDSLWSGWVRQPINDVQIPLEPLPVAARIAEKEMDIEITQIKIGFPTAYYGDEDLPALRVLGFILSGVSTSRLDLRLVQNDNPLMRSIYAYSSEKLRERGQFIIGGSFEYENRDTILNVIWDEIEKVKRYGVSSEEVEWAKSYLAKDLLYQNETVSGQASSMLYSFLASGKPFTLDFYLQRVERVSVDDVQRVAQKYLVPEHMICAILKPIGATCPGDSILVAKKSSGKPEFVVKKLENGLKLVLAENQSLPTMDIYIYLFGGTIFEPAEKPGIAYFTTSYLDEGTQKYPSFKAIRRKMDLQAIRLSVGCGMHTMYLKGNFVASDFDEALELTSELLLHPLFPENSAQKLRQQQLSNIKGQHDSWYSDAHLFYCEKFFRNHPYGRSKFGTEEAVKNFTAEDAREYWFSHLNPENMVIAVAGPVPVDVMAEKIERFFGNLRSSNTEFPEISAPERHLEPEEYVKKVNREQVTLIIGFDGCDIKNENDKWALKTAASLLNGTGGLSGWLSVELRGKRNLVYIVWASSGERLYGGDFTITTQCEPQDVDTVKSVILGLIDRLKNGDFEEEDVERITNAMANRFLMSQQKQEWLVSSAALDELYDMGWDYSQKYPEKIKAVRKADVIRVANEYFKNPVVIMMEPEENDEQ